MAIAPAHEAGGTGAKGRSGRRAGLEIVADAYDAVVAGRLIISIGFHGGMVIDSLVIPSYVVVPVTVRTGTGIVRGWVMYASTE